MLVDREEVLIQMVELVVEVVELELQVNPTHSLLQEPIVQMVEQDNHLQILLIHYASQVLLHLP